MSIYFNFKIARLTSWLLRFRTLPKAKRIFNSVESPCIMRRKMFGYDFYVDVSRSITHQLIYLDGERFVPEHCLIKSLLKQGMSVVDVGANIGYYLLLFERCIGKQGQVFCIEPSPENLSEFRYNIKSNGFSNVKLFDVALGIQDGTTGLKNGINSGISDLKHGVYEVDIRRLDSLLKDKVDFVKIDVEGYEGLVLEGAKGLIERDRPILFLEFHPLLVGKFGFTFQRIHEFLKTHYENITYYDVPEKLRIVGKLGVRYYNINPVRRLELSEMLLSNMHTGHQYGTFWIVCK